MCRACSFKLPNDASMQPAGRLVRRRPNVCGDSDQGPSEECDDGTDNGDMNNCTADYRNNICGDGKVGPDEGCDDSNANDDRAHTSAPHAFAVERLGGGQLRFSRRVRQQLVVPSDRPHPTAHKQATRAESLGFSAPGYRATDRESPSLPPRFGEILEKAAGVEARLRPGLPPCSVELLGARAP
jgi:hypothetical protein